MRSKFVLAAVLILAGAFPALAQTRVVTGRVTDSLTTEVVNSGQVSVVGTTIGTTIKEDGTFTLAVPVRDVTVSVRSIGFKRKDVNVAAGQSTVDLSLARDYFQLEAIVVTGQATGVERRNLANAVATVNADQLAKVSAASVSQALAGKLASANIVSGSGAPGGNDIVTLRGVTSINGAFTPLYVIDGVIASDVMIPRGTNFVSQASRGTTIAVSGENSTNRIADLNPNDIENVEVLKGAAASAIYGSKASNGVIIITTKRGRVGAPQFAITQRVGTARVSRTVGLRRFPSLADAVARYGALANDPVTGWAADKFFDNEQYLVGGKPFNYETNLSMNGGTENTRYYASALVRHEGGIIHNTFADKRTLKLNVDQSVGSRLQIQIGTDVANTSGDKGLTINENNNSSYYAGLSNTPSFFDLRATCPDGTRQSFCTGGVYPVNPYVAANPLHTASAFKNYEDVWRVLGSGRMQLDIVNSVQHTLRLIANGGADYFNQDNRVFSPPELQFEALDGLLGTSVVSESRNLNYNLNANGVYTLKTSGFSATTQVGTQYETRELFIDRVRSSNLVGGLQITTAGTDVGIDAQHEYVKDFGFFAQEEFLTLGEKLLLTLGVRADKSSNNGDPNKLFYYPKASASYRFPGLVPGMLDELKLRAAFGQSGNQPRYGAKFTALQGLNVGGVPAGQIAAAAAAPNIVPERQREIEAGLDATLFNARANLEVTAYQKRITDLLLSRSLARSYGFTSEFLNGGILTTKGLEVALSGVPIQTAAVQWNPRISFHSFRSTIDSLPVPKFGGCSFGGGGIRIEQGGSATAIYGRDSTVTVDPVTGAPVAKGACIKIGENRPDYTLQFSSDLTVKAFRLSLVLDRQKGGRVANLTQWLYDLNRNSPDWDVPYPGDGRPTGQVRPLQFSSGNRLSSVYVQDASYLRLREATLGIDLPNRMVHRFWSGARYVRLSLSGRNLWISTPYQGVDSDARWVVEQGAASRLGQELWAYPPSRTFWLTLDVGF
ncbi:MAG: SusC/RagA family TonB-linked outer membrane protein [Gemmatimonadetes bacterium]|nr:SusC/RagA family TonB-linked outer membrane protein [Gemmatimonadota bacterium]